MRPLRDYRREVREMTRQELETTNEQIGYRLSEIATEMNRLRLERDTALIQVLEPEILRPVCPKCLTEVSKGERKNRLKMHYHCFLQHQVNGR